MLSFVSYTVLVNYIYCLGDASVSPGSGGQEWQLKIFNGNRFLVFTLDKLSKKLYKSAYKLKVLETY